MIESGECSVIVTTAADPAIHDAIDATYHAKYDPYGPGPISHLTGLDAHAVTIRLARSDDLD